jgi:hypothetical protein
MESNTPQLPFSLTPILPHIYHSIYLLFENTSNEVWQQSRKGNKLVV